ncbi:hypothetical protein MKW98_027830 [Papaver atlanticum]|uniref:Peptidase A1 domain-containing protein n=1 Tax=Papaver atlanticum TaxID=357466 RepID=A0AAD4SL70_9MAGN|nr:hypothetical protein MKW98_027830 [Papaver atlanticum]
MATSIVLSSCILFTVLGLISLTLNFTFVLSSSSSQMVFPLTHSLSTTGFNNTHHLLKSTSVRSTTRFHHHHRHRHNHHRHHSHRQRQISLPLSPGSDYTLSLSLGTKPTQQISLYMDTGSDLVWFPCAPFDCIMCEGKYDPKVPYIKPLNYNNSADFIPCDSPLCSAVHSSLPSSDICAISNCPLESIEMSECSSFACPSFYYAYADGSFVARLYRDNLSLEPMSSSSTTTQQQKSLHLKNFTFGCANTALAEPIGVAGFGGGSLSLPAQLATFSPELGNRFSYCLISHSFKFDRIRKPSPLILGRYDDQKEKKISDHGGAVASEFIYTPMLDNPKHPYYYCVGLEAIQIGTTKIDTPMSLKRVNSKGNGGTVVDSGTTFTMLPSVVFEAVANEFGNRVGKMYKRAIETEDRTGLRPCFYYNNRNNKRGNWRVPKMVLHFTGNVSISLPQANYFFEFNGDDDEEGKKKKRKGEKVGCLMLGNAGEEEEGESSGPAAALGSYQQQGFEVVYDLGQRKIGFAKKKCSSLWDNLNS